MRDVKKILNGLYKNKHRFVNEKSKSGVIDTRNDLYIIRKLKEDYVKKENVTALDQRKEEDKFNDYFSEYNVLTDFEPLEIYENGIFWGGTIDNVLQWVFTIPSEKKEPIISFLNNYKPQDQENSDKYGEIEEQLKNYYNEFFEYWNDNELED